MSNNIEVRNRNYEPIALFSKSDIQGDTFSQINAMIDPEISITQNGDSTLTFKINANSDKWQDIKDVNNLYYAGGRVFSPLYGDSYIRTIGENSEQLMTVTAKEIWNELDKMYVRAWNSTTGFAAIDDFMVVILSGGVEPLQNDGHFVVTDYPSGSAGYALEGLLYGTGWTLLNCSVEGTYDLETEQLSVLENIKKVQELWGGILIWDSEHKTLRLEDETVYTNYNGYVFRKGKNIISIEDKSSNEIVTRLIPLGEAGLNIKDINGGKIYLEDHTYSTENFEKIISNADIYDQTQLKNWGMRKLKEKSRPQKTLSVAVADLRETEEHSFETFDINETVEVDYDDISERLRVTTWTYKVFNYADSTVTLSDTVLNARDVFVQISDTIRGFEGGTIGDTKVIDTKTGKTVETLLKEEGTKVTALQTGLTNTNTRVTTAENNITNIQSTLNDGLNKIVSGDESNYVIAKNNGIEYIANKHDITGDVYINGTQFTGTAVFG